MYKLFFLIVTVAVHASDGWINDSDKRCGICRDIVLTKDNALQKTDQYIVAKCSKEHRDQFHKSCAFKWMNYCKDHKITQVCPLCKAEWNSASESCLLCNEKLSQSKTALETREEHRFRGKCLSYHGSQYHGHCLHSFIKKQANQGKEALCLCCDKPLFAGRYSAWPTMKKIMCKKPAITFAATVLVASVNFCTWLPAAKEDGINAALFALNIGGVWAMALYDVYR